MAAIQSCGRSSGMRTRSSNSLGMNDCHNNRLWVIGPLGARRQDFRVADQPTGPVSERSADRMAYMNRILIVGATGNVASSSCHFPTGTRRRNSSKKFGTVLRDRLDFLDKCRDEE